MFRFSLKSESMKLDHCGSLVQWVSIIYQLKEDSSFKICLLHEKVKSWMGWSKNFAKTKTQLPSWVEKGQKANLSQAHLDEGSFGCHHLPRLCLLSMVQVGKVDMAKFVTCELKTLIKRLHTLSLLAKN